MLIKFYTLLIAPGVQGFQLTQYEDIVSIYISNQIVISVFFN